MLRVEEIHTIAEAEALQAKWAELQERMPGHSVFLSYQWFWACIRNLDPGQKLLILKLMDGIRMVGLVPLVQQQLRIRGLPVTQIRLLESPLSPFVDFLLLDLREGLNAILQHLFKARRGWDILSLRKLRENSPSLATLCSLLQNEKCPFFKTVVSRTPFLLIDQSWEEFYKSKSRKFRMTRRSITNRIQRLGDLTVQQITSRQEAEKALEQMLQVGARSAKRRQNRDVLDPTVERSFFADLIRQQSQQVRFRLWLLTNHSETLAAEFHIEDGDTVYALRAHYDEHYAAYSPGSYLDFTIVQQLFQGRYRCYDMGPGTASYKMAWTESMYSCYKLDVYNCTAYARFLSRLHYSWIPALKNTALGRWVQKRRG